MYVYMYIHIGCPLALFIHVQNCVSHAGCHRNRLKPILEAERNSIRYPNVYVFYSDEKYTLHRTSARFILPSSSTKERKIAKTSEHFEKWSFVIPDDPFINWTALFSFRKSIHFKCLCSIVFFTFPSIVSLFLSFLLFFCHSLYRFCDQFLQTLSDFKHSYMFNLQPRLRGK